MFYKIFIVVDGKEFEIDAVYEDLDELKSDLKVFVNTESFYNVEVVGGYLAFCKSEVNSVYFFARVIK